jgi:hypothetical protein
VQIGVVHSSYATSESVQRLLSTLYVPVINVDTTADSVAGSPLHMGAGTTDAIHMRAFAMILARLNWTYANVLVEESLQMAPAAQQMRTLAHAHGVCIHRSLTLAPSSTLQQAQLVVRQLVLSEARAIVLILSDANTRLLMRALLAENVTPGRFVLLSRYDADWALHSEFVTLMRTFTQGWLLVNDEPITNQPFIDDFNGKCCVHAYHTLSSLNTEQWTAAVTTRLAE